MCGRSRKVYTEATGGGRFSIYKDGLAALPTLALSAAAEAVVTLQVPFGVCS